jgi:hypothetical protein
MKKWIIKMWGKLFGSSRRQERKFLMQVGASTMNKILRNRDLRRTIQHKCPALDMRLLRLGVNVRQIAADKNK